MGRRGLSGQNKSSGRSQRPPSGPRNGHTALRQRREPARATLPEWASPLRLRRNKLEVVREDLNQTRHTLLQRLKDVGDDGSWRDFFDAYWRLIYTTAIRAGLTPEESQDVVQKTVLSVFKNIHKFKVGSEHGKFKAWLLTVTRWRIEDQRRERDRCGMSHTSPVDEDTTNTPLIEGIADPASFDMDAKWEQDWQQNLIDTAIERVKIQVDPLDYQMFDLHVLKLWPASKVAALLNVKIGNVYFAKYNILGRIKKEVKKIESDLI